MFFPNRILTFRNVYFSMLLLSMLFCSMQSGRAAPLDVVAPSAGLHWGSLTVSPFADVLYFYDTNYDRDRVERSASHGPSVRTGFDFNYGGNRHKFSGQFWYQWEKYVGESRLDNNQWRESIRYMYETPQGTVFRVDHYWGELYQSDFETGLWQDRSEFQLLAGVAHALSPKTRIQLDVGFEDVEYKNEALYDWNQYSIDLSVARRISPKTDIFVGSGIAFESSESYSGYSKSYRLNAGFASRASEKVTYRVAVGAEAFDFAGADDTLDWSPYYQLSASWKASRKWAWTLTGQGQHQNSEESAGNYTETYTLGFGATYQMNRRMSASMRALLRFDDLNYDVIDPDTGNLTGKKDTEFGIRTDFNYRLSKYASLRMGAEAVTQRSTIAADDYNRYRVDMGLSFRY